jgi:hypothetical protein
MEEQTKSSPLKPRRDLETATTPLEELVME